MPSCEACGYHGPEVREAPAPWGGKAWLCPQDAPDRVHAFTRPKWCQVASEGCSPVTVMRREDGL